MDPLGTIIKIEDALAALRLEAQQLKQENEELKERLELQEPLVQVGVAIRCRFFEQAREIRGHGQAFVSIIEAGNAAAHRGDYIADSAMFEMGYMRMKKKILNPQGCVVPLEETYATLYKELYSTGITMRSAEWLNPISLRLPIQDPNNPRKGVELYNLNVNIASCCPEFGTALFNHDLEDLNRFYFLACQFVGAYCDMEKRISTKSELHAAFDTCPDIERMLIEMREITERVVRMYSVRHRRISRRDAAGPEFEW
jgi:hypothetical protein